MKALATTLLVGWWLWLGPAFAQELRGASVLAQIAQAIDDEDIDQANLLAASADPLIRDLAGWLIYRAGHGSFSEMAAFVARRPDWPGFSRIRLNAEESIDDQTRPAEIIAFLDGQEVETGQGAVAYGRALIDAGRRNEADAMLIRLWRSSALTDEGHQAVVNAFANVIAPHHADRADMLLWRWRTDDAANLLPLLDEGQRALVGARIALITHAPDVREREDLVPDRLQNDPGLHYDRFNWFADRGDWSLASAILLDRSTDAAALGVPWRWGSWRRILARWQMREGNAKRAYALASEHFIAPDERNYADLEWVSGYIALTYLGDPERALIHFQRFDASVTSPISKGRAGYWLGRAYQDLGDAEAAVAAFRAGAQHQTSFYGLLSAEQLGLTLNSDLVGGERFGDWRQGPLLQNETIRAGLSLLQAGERGAAVLFFVQAARGLPRQQIGQLGALFEEMQEPFYTVLIAKTAVAEGTWVQDAYFPIHPLAQMDLPVEPALALSIARQESEFRVDAGSAVGALGLMQLMPDTARDVAGWLDLPYSRGRLTSDWVYNATLGAEYLAYLTQEFGDSPVMIAAGYNAGPSRPKTWIEDRGDPRVGFGNPDPVDVIDWIEHIPFRETRNYVMRVTEGIPVYRARLTGRIGPVRFEDILLGAPPIIRPLARPEGLLRPPAAPVVPPVRSTGAFSSDAPPNLRPVARPAGD